MRNLLFCFLITVFICPSVAQTNKERSVEFARKGIKLVDQKKYAEGIATLRLGAALDPENPLFNYEIAAAFYLQAQYDSVVTVLEPVLSKPDVNDQFYQVLGNAWDMKKMPEKAMQTYQAGLARFPGSGILYLECGILMLAADSIKKAIGFWESGVKADPGISSNYYYLAKILAASDDKQWALLYGEVFMNIERNSKRSEEMSRLMYETYFSFLQKPVDIMSAVMAGDNTAGALNDTTNILTSFHHQLRSNGHYEAYIHWMLMKGDEDGFTAWFNRNTEKYKAFVAWFSKNPMKISKENFISRTR